jgi:hypothetical protein
MSDQKEYIPVVDFYTGDLLFWLPKDSFEYWSVRKQTSLVWYSRNFVYNYFVTYLEVKHGKYNQQQ